MALTCKNCMLLGLAIPLLFLALAVFVATLALAVIGISKASDLNVCSDSNSTRSCVPSSLIVPPEGEEVEDDVLEDDPNEFIYWLAGATGCGLLFALICTLSLWVLEDALRRIRKTTSPLKEEIEMEEKGDSVDARRSPTPPPPMDSVEEENIYPKPSSDLRKLNCGALTALFLSCVFGILALLAMLWAIAIGLNHSRRQEITVVPFVIVELLVAIAFPFLFFVGGIIMANVIDFVTFGAVDARRALPNFLKSVEFKEGGKSDYWVIEKTFFFGLKKRDKKERVQHGFCYSCYPNFATWVLVAIVSLSVNLAVSYFADITLDKQISVTSCTDPRIDRTFSCFNSSTLTYVDCITNTNVELIHCFKFYRFGVDVDLIQSIATTYAFYLVASSAFGHLFILMKVLLHLSKRRVWGFVLVFTGMLLFLLSVALILVWMSGYISAALGELSRLNVINLAQFVMVSWFVILVGLLMVGGTWVEKEKKKKTN